MSGRPIVSGAHIGGMDEPWSGGRIGERAFCVLAPNPSPMTLDGTNTWVLGSPDAGEVIVVDPGPEDDAHLDAVLAHINAQGARVNATLLTHGHSDHSAAARRWHERTGAPVLALDPQHRYGSEGLSEGDYLRAGDLAVEVVATPGHTQDSVCFVLADDRQLLTGDTVLGRGTTVVAWPDGQLQAYLDSLHRLTDVIADQESAVLLPGHGPALHNPGAVVADYLDHRHERLNQVRAAVAAGATTAAEIVSIVYGDIPAAVRPAAQLSAQAQLDYLNAG
ncbi:MAG: MBL fold metallo-hydrolase [Candidatus Nanopelagicales bacterium]